MLVIYTLLSTTFRIKFDRESAPTNSAIKLMVEKFEKTESVNNSRNKIYRRVIFQPSSCEQKY